MGLLAPLYALAALAIVGPIIFHLIKRQPQGQQKFSSLMFLSPSPPRLTRRSRLDNILLLILRALAIGLIAFAFARPFFRQESFLNQTLEGRNIAILIDTSASMQRPDVWDATKDQSLKIIDSLSPGDRISLYSISDHLETLVGLDTDGVSDAASQQQAVRAAVKELKPTWRGSKVADGLKSVADLIQAAAIAGKLGGDNTAELVLISDLHANCGVESLQGYPWPETIRLDVRQVRSTSPGNARASLIASEEVAEDSAEPAMKVRIENNSDSPHQSFELKWITADAVTSSSTTLQVPPGQVRIIPAPPQPSGARELTLVGDSWDGDNKLFVAEPLLSRERILFVGPTETRKEEDLAYFIEKAPLSTALVHRSVERVALSELDAQLQTTSETQSIDSVRAVIIEPPFSSLETERLRLFAKSGGCVLVCLARPQKGNSDAQSSLRELFSMPTLEVSEAETKDFALLSSIDFTSPVFRPFADPRFNDFSKVRFWTHRRVKLNAIDAEQITVTNESEDRAQPATEVRVVASLDDGSPWLLQQALGDGNLWVVTSGWQPTSSQLGLSSKFIPILLGILDPTGNTLTAQLVYSVGETIPTVASANLKVTDAAGTEVALASNDEGLLIESPGLYFIEENKQVRQIAVQVPTSESLLTPLDIDVFEQYGIELGKVQTDAERKQNARQLQVTELEQKQRVWQWLLLAGLIVLAVETTLAGWLTRRASASIPNAQPQAAG